MKSSKKELDNGWPKRAVPHYSNSETSFHVEKARNHEECATELEQQLEQRLKQQYNAIKTHNSTPDASRKERFAVFSECFEEIIRQHGTFSPLLSDIKHEYENCIETVFRGEKEAAFLYRNLTTGISGPKTLVNYKERIRDLERKKYLLRKSNVSLRKQIVKTEAKMMEKQTRRCQVFARPKNPKQSLSSSVKMAAVSSTGFEALEENREFRMRVLEMYSPSQQTDVGFLNRELQRLQDEIHDLKKVFDKRYKLREMKDRLVEKLLEKERVKNELQDRWLELKEQIEKREEVIRHEKELRGAEEERLNKKVMTINELVKNIILMAAQSCGSKDEVVLPGKTRTACKPEAANSTQDSAVEQEDHEEMVNYMETFERLFKQGDFEEAAIVAATSPQDILRTAKTFQRFKEKRAKFVGDKSPLVQFCEAISVTATPDSGQKGLSVGESIDAVERALTEGLRDLVVEWMSQNKLKLSDSLGETILRFCTCAPVPCACGFCVLAEVVFRSTKAHGSVITCLCRQGRLSTAIHYGRNVGKFRKREFMDALSEFPRFEFASLLLEASGGYLSAPLCLEECVNSLVRTGNYNDVVRLITCSGATRLRSHKVLGNIRLEDWNLWENLLAIMNNELGLVDIVYDAMSIIVLCEVFYGVKYKLSL